MQPIQRTPLGAIGRGLVAGVAGTAAMTALQAVEQRLTANGGGEQEPPASWDETPAPAQVGERVMHGIFHRPLRLARAPVLTNVVHWSYGTALGGWFGILQDSLAIPRGVDGVLFGTLVMASDYSTLPAMGIYKPAWKYSPKTLAVDLGRHLVYGIAVAATYRALDRRSR